MASLYPTAEEARTTCAIVAAAAKVRDLNSKYLAEGKGATVTARFCPDGITICDPNRTNEGADKDFSGSAIGRYEPATFLPCVVPSFCFRFYFTSDSRNCRRPHGAGCPLFMKMISFGWVGAVVVAVLLTVSSARAAEYPCSAFTNNPAGLAGKTLWLEITGTQGTVYESSGSYRVILNANGTYSVPATNGISAKSGAWTILNGALNFANWFNDAIPDVFVVFPISGISTPCQYYLFREGLGIPPGGTQSGNLRITDGEEPVPQAPQVVYVSGVGTYSVGTSALLQGLAVGNGPLTLRWSKGATTLATTNVQFFPFTLTNLQLSDAGTYAFSASNSVGVVTNTVVLTVVTGAVPTITSQPLSAAANLGQNAVFTVGASGTLPLTLQWRRDGTNLVDGGNITGATGSDLYIIGVTATDYGAYSVVVTNLYGSVTSAVATLAPGAAPIISQQPTNFTGILTNASFTLTVAATGSPPPTYEWRKGGVAIPGATNPSYFRIDTNYSAGGNYTVFIGNQFGSVTSAVAQVTVYESVLYPGTPAPTDANIAQGNSLDRRFNTYGLPPVYFTWKRNGTNIPGFAGVIQSGISNGTAFSLLSLPNMQPLDSGSYQAVAGNAFNSVTSVVFSVLVQSTGGPVIYQQPASYTAYIGLGGVGFATQRVAVSSSTAVQYQWFSNGVAQAGSTATQATFTAFGPQVLDTVVRVTNSFGAATSLVGQVSFVYAPGAVDTNFLVTSNLNGSVQALAPQTDGSVIAGGSFTAVGSVANTRNRLAKFNANGTLDTAWLGASNALNGEVNALVPIGGGKIFVGGNFTDLGAGLLYSGLARISTNGSLDTTFLAGTNTGRFIDGAVRAIAVRASDGAIAVGGVFTNVAGAVQKAVALFDSNGIFQTTFRPNFTNSPGNSPQVNALAFQPDGKLVVGGSFTNVNGSARSYLARLNADGSLDTGFNTTTGPNGLVNALLVQPDGRIIAGGGFTQVGTSNRNGVAQFATNGTVTANYNISASSTYVLALQGNSNVIIGGSFSGFGAVRANLTRGLTNGIADGLFPGNGIGSPNGAVSALAFSPDGNSLWIGGAFTTIGVANTSQGVARLTTESLAGPLVSPTLGSIFVAGGNLSFTLPTVNGRTYEIQFKNSLSDLMWMTYQVINGDGTVKTVNIPTSASAAFYRIVVQ